MSVRVLIAGGGTAGHVFPALALGHRLARDDHQVRFAGTATGQEATLVPAAGFELARIQARPFVRALSLRSAMAPVVALRSVAHARPLVEGADVVVGMGGYVSVPVALAALRWRRPLILHEQNAVPGLANRILSRRASAVALSFIEAARSLPGRARTVVTGNPIREQVLAVSADRAGLAETAYRELDLDPSRSTVVVFGGSQGAVHLNRAIADALGALGADPSVQFLVVTGPAHEADTRAATVGSGARVRVLGFLERMELAYAIADLAVARAGATTVAELSVCGIPSILVPYPYATRRHQEANARALERAGGALVMLDDELSGPTLRERLGELLGAEDRLRSMGERARAWSRPEATEALARVVIGAASSPTRATSSEGMA